MKRYVIASTALVGALVIAVGLVFILIGRAVEASDRHWCDTLTLLTSRPVARPTNPAANPSRAGQYALYQDFVKLRREFGC
jgi:hypothetical protein